MITGSITAKPQVFAAAVKWAAAYLDARPAIPVWAGLLLEIDNGTLAVTSMNEYVSAVATLPVEGMGSGRAVVSGRLLKELVSTFPDKPVEITGNGGDDSLVMVAGRWKGTLPTFAEGDYPQVPDAPATIGTVPGEEFAHAVAEVTAATSKDAEKPAGWRSVLLAFGADLISVHGTDSYRAAAAACEFTWVAKSHEASALVLASQMTDVAAGFIGPDDIEVGLSASQISLASRSRSVVMRLMDPKDYPAEFVMKLTDKEMPEHAIVRKAELLLPMKRAALVREKDGPIAVTFSTGVIGLAASSEQGRADGTDEVDAEYDGSAVTFHLNPGYFGDALASAPGETVDIAFSTETDRGRPFPVLLTVKGSAWRHLLMPIKK